MNVIIKLSGIKSSLVYVKISANYRIQFHLILLLINTFSLDKKKISERSLRNLLLFLCEMINSKQFNYDNTTFAQTCLFYKLPVYGNNEKLSIE